MHIVAGQNMISSIIEMENSLFTILDHSMLMDITYPYFLSFSVNSNYYD